MQLVAYGAQDIYLTGNPQITFFKVVYRRHTNFSMETIQQTIAGSSTLSSSSTSGTVTISRNGDLVSKVYVTTSTAGVLNGSALINEVEVEIGGQMIDRQYQEWNDIWNELTITDSKSHGFKTMTCAGLESGTTGPGMVQIPLNFWFCRNPGLALPLIALQYHEVKLKFTWGTSASTSAGVTAQCNVWCDYIYLDTDERRRFAQVSHEYLIEQIQRQSVIENVSNTLNFNHPVKELIWTSDHKTPYVNAKLQLNGHDRFAAQEEEYFQLRQPYEYHTAIPHQNNGLANFISGSGTAALSAASLCIADISHGIGTSSLALTALEFNAVTIGGVVGGIGDPISHAWSHTTRTGDGEVVAAGTTDTNIIAILGTTAGHAFKRGSLKVGDAHEISIYDSSDLTVPVAGSTKVMTVRALWMDADEGDIPVNGKGPVAIGQTVHTISTDMHRDTAVGTLFVEYQHGLSGSVVAITHTIADGDAFVVNHANQSGHARTSTMIKHINVYSFALKPEEHQPSGTCNFSRIDNAQLITSTTLEPSDNIYAVNYNVLRIMSGMGGLAYSN